MPGGTDSEREREALKARAAEYYGARPPPWEVEAADVLAAAVATAPLHPWDFGWSGHQWMAAQRAYLEELHRPVQHERGKYLDEMTTIDWTLGGLIANYFGVAEERVSEFAQWVLHRVGFAAKADILGSIVESRGLQEECGSLSSDLKLANDLRNVLAHAFMDPTTFPSIFVTMRKGKMTPHTYTVEELRDHVDRASNLHGRVLQIGFDIAEEAGRVKNAFPHPED